MPDFGFGPYGVGTPATAPNPGGEAPRGVKFLNHITGDYERDSTGAYKRMPRIRQRVVLALGTIYGSATAIPDLGTKYPDKITESFTSQVKSEVQRALLPMTSAGEIRVDSVTVDLPQAGRVEVTVAYTTADGTQDSATV